MVFEADIDCIYIHRCWYVFFKKPPHFHNMTRSAELHQLTSPHTAYNFLDTLLEKSESASRSLEEVSLFSSYVLKSWRGIIKSSGIL